MNGEGRPTNDLGARIRPYRPDDREALYAVALATGRDGVPQR